MDATEKWESKYPNAKKVGKTTGLTLQLSSYFLIISVRLCILQMS